MPFLLKKPENEAGATLPAILIGLFVAFGGVLYGYDTGTISGIIAMPYWRNNFSTGFINAGDGLPDVSPSQSSVIVSLLSAGTFFGALTAAPTCDRLGRRLGLMVSTIVFVFGVILQTAATAINMFVAGRFFAGYGVGMISAAVPLYQSETSPKWIRGTIVGAYQLAITIGLLIAAIVDNATKDRNDSGSYRIPIAVQFAWALIMFFGMILLPETPRYLIKKGKMDQAARALSRLRRLEVDHPGLLEELGEITANHEYELGLGKASYIDCVKGSLGRRLFTGCAVQALQQLSGVNFIFYYGTSFFKNSGISNAFTITLITACVNVASTFPGLYLVESWGRRPLLLMGAIGMCVCQFIVAITGTVAGVENMAAQQALIAFVCIYIFFFASSWGPCAWVVTGEIFPLKVRAKSLSITTASNWLFNWAIAYATPYLVGTASGDANLGSKVFFVWGSACFLCTAFVYFCIYETKGLSLEEVDEMYAKVGNAWQSKGFVPTVSFQQVQAMGGEGKGLSLGEKEGETERRNSVERSDDDARKSA